MARRLDEKWSNLSAGFEDKTLRKTVEEALKFYLCSFLSVTSEGVGRREITPGNYLYEKTSCFSLKDFRSHLRHKCNILLETADDLEELMAMAMDLMFGPNKIGNFVIIPKKMDSNISFVILRVSRGYTI